MKRNPQILQVFCNLQAKSANCKRNPHNFAESTYLRNPLTFVESGKITYSRPLRYPQKKLIAEKIYVTGICTPNPWKFVDGINSHFETYLNTCFWNRGTYRHKIVQQSSTQFGLVRIVRSLNMQKSALQFFPPLITVFVFLYINNFRKCVCACVTQPHANMNDIWSIRKKWEIQIMAHRGKWRKSRNFLSLRL